MLYLRLCFYTKETAAYENHCILLCHALKLLDKETTALLINATEHLVLFSRMMMATTVMIEEYHLHPSNDNRGVVYCKNVDSNKMHCSLTADRTVRNRPYPRIHTFPFPASTSRQRHCNSRLHWWNSPCPNATVRHFQ
jgi:hypothetical protein